MLARHFYSCSVAVKLRLFKSFCLCFHDAALWNIFTAGSFNKFRSAYVKCIKKIFRYTKFYSVTAMFNELNLQNFDSLIDECRIDFQRQVHVCDNGIVQHFVNLHSMWFYVIQLCVTVLLYVSLLFVIVNVFFTINVLFFYVTTVLWAHCLK